MTTGIAVILILSGVIAYFVYATKHGKNVMHVGLAASQAYLYYGSNECKLAALTTKAVLAKPLGEKMLFYISAIDCPKDSIDMTDFEARKRDLFQVLAKQESSLAASLERKKELASVSPNWLRAISGARRPLADKLFAEQVARHTANIVIAGRTQT